MNYIKNLSKRWKDGLGDHSLISFLYEGLTIIATFKL